MDADFSRLYSQLDLRPDCTLEELKQAYRRRVAELHPDRRGEAGVQQEDDQQLAGLIRLYKTALRFHRLHGRLPGSVAGTASDPPNDASASRRQDASNERVAPTADKAIRVPSPSWWLVAALATVVFYLLLSVSDEVAETDATSPGANQPDAAALEAPRTTQLALGMTMLTVLEVQGRPTHMESAVWEYGPSWVRFEDGKLVEWYSSPLYRLKTPQPRAGER